MKGCLVVLGILTGLAICAVIFFQLNFYDVRVRYRLTVEVQDGDQVKTGSSVIEVSYNIEPKWSPSHFNAFPTPTGYAPTVDLGKKGMLYLTFSDATRTPEQRLKRRKQTFCLFDDIGCLPFAAYHKSAGGVEFSQKKAALDDLLRQSGSRDVPFIALPQFLCFLDVNDQRKYVDLPPDNLALCFGPAVELKRVVLQLTEDQVTPMPESWPQWLKEKGQMAAVLKGFGSD